jgi:hypothetical protein
MHPRFFDREPIEGMPVSTRGIARGLRRMAHALETMTVDGGYITRTPGFSMKIVIDPPVAARFGGDLWRPEIVTIDEAPAFRLHRAAVRIGRTYYTTIVRDTIGAPGNLYATVTGVPRDQTFAAVVDVDWANTGTLFEAELKLLTGIPITNTAIWTHPGTGDAVYSSERIPVAFYGVGVKFVADLYHGVYTPQVMVP